jgi:hypothetical protein
VTIRLTTREAAEFIADGVRKRFAMTSEEIPMAVRFVEVYGDGSGEGIVNNLTRVDVEITRDA